MNVGLNIIVSRYFFFCTVLQTPKKCYKSNVLTFYININICKKNTLVDFLVLMPYVIYWTISPSFVPLNNKYDKIVKKNII